MPELSGIAAVRRDRPIRVLVTSPPMNRHGGVSQYLRILRSHMRNDVEYFTIGSRSDDERAVTKLLRVVQDSWRFVHTLRHGGHDIVHLNPSILPKALLRDGALLLIAKALRKAVVVFAHGWDDACGRALSTHLSRLFRLVYGRADAFIVLGNEFKNRVRQMGYDRTVFVHGAPIEDDLLQYCQHQRVGKYTGGSGPKFNILFLARVEKDKGIYEALETYRLLKQEHPFLSLTVAGDGSQLNNAIHYASTRRLADLSFVGFVESTAKYEVFKSADAYLFPSYSEGLPLSVLEAMACGLPIVTCAVGGLRDFFQDGWMGFITESRDPTILASLLSRLIYDPNLCSRISDFNQKYARDQFTASQVAARLEEVYGFILARADRSVPETSLRSRRSPPELKDCTSSYLKGLIEHFCVRDDLSTHDPYDIWNTALGFRVKKLYNRRPRLGLFPAAVCALFDDLVNHRLRLFYTRNEYPIVRAMAALCLLNLYRNNRDSRLLEGAERHLQWLLTNSCRGYSGYCWGLGFPHAVSSDLVYDRRAPFSVITPYALEAFVSFSQVSEDMRFQPVIESIFRFFDNDIQVMEEDEKALATSYGPFRDRTVINAVSYTMYSYSLFLPYAARHQRQRIEEKVRKLYAYICRKQRLDGSWYYSPHGRSFIDCFHSCIVLKNVIKSDRIVKLDDSAALVAAGYEYLRKAFLDERHFLFKRFSVRNKPGLVRFDLYDNAEMLNLAMLLGDSRLVQSLLASVLQHFCRALDVYSQIDFIGRRRNKNTLRWAVMPFLYAVSEIVQAGKVQGYDHHTQASSSK